ncbi:MAG TPA: DUF2949 domain-containing protein [Synechococcales cyanobacterium M55_K2018_004]|nr:DUF2949 domain-containing protein [Synechococcales cyanobacterium M55_K2018_004]
MAAESTTQTRLIRYLREELQVPAEAIAVALRHSESASNVLPMVLWQYGLITIDQLNRIFDWMETA